jgi:DNA-binding MarR family transcriptional regulator
LPDTPVNDDVFLLAQFSLLYRNMVDSFVESLGMYRGQAMVLCTVVKQNGLTQSEIAELLSVQGATITNMLKPIEEAKLITRQRDPEDNRQVRVYVTDAGQAIEAMIGQRFKELEDVIFQDISEEKRDLLRELMMQMINNMENNRE